MDDRTANEAALFVRYEARIVGVELACEACQAWRAKYGPIVDELKVGDEIANAVAKRLSENRTLGLSRVHVALAIGALFIPPFVSALVVVFLTRAAKG